MTTETIVRNDLRATILKTMKDHNAVYFVWKWVQSTLKNVTEDEITDAVQGMMDAGEICIVDDAEDGIALFRCVIGDEPEDDEADYILSAREAFEAAKREWEFSREPETEAEDTLLKQLRETSFGSSVRMDGLLQALSILGDVRDWWPIFEQLTAKRKISFCRHRSGELFIELTDGYEIDTVHRLKGLQELKAILKQ